MDGGAGAGAGGRARLLMQLMLASESDASDDDAADARGAGASDPDTQAQEQDARGVAAHRDDSDVEYVPHRAPGPKRKKRKLVPGPQRKKAQVTAGPGPRRPGPGRPGLGRPGAGEPAPGGGGPGRRGRPPAPAAATPRTESTPTPGTSRKAYARRSHHNSIDSRKSAIASLTQEQESCSDEAPPGEFVQLALTRVYEPLPSSRTLAAVLGHAAAAPAQAALLLDCLPEVAAASVETRVAHALCRAGDAPMRDYRFQEPLVPLAHAHLAEAERSWRGELAQLRAQTGAHAHTLREVRAVCAAPPAPPAPAGDLLRGELDELLRCVKDYHDALKDVHTVRAAGEAALDDSARRAVRVRRAGAAASLRNSSAATEP